MSRCILCSIEREPKHLFTRDGVKIVKCKGCGLMHVDPIPPASPDVYSGSYIAYWDSGVRVHEEARERLRLFSKWKIGGKLLDVGCGIGVFLNEAQKAGWEVCGTETSEWAVNSVKNRYGLDVFKGPLREARFPNASFDVVTLWHVLEHMPDPVGELREVNRLLKDDGIVCVEVPNAGSLEALVRRKGWPYFGHEHLYHFSMSSLRLTGATAGLVPVSVRGISGYGRCRSSHSLPKKVIHRVLTSANAGNRLFFVFERARKCGTSFSSCR